jgi:hypothetical protein
LPESGFLRSIVWNWPPVAELCVEKNAEQRDAPDTARKRAAIAANWEIDMHQLIYLVGLIVVILAILSFFGLR